MLELRNLRWGLVPHFTKDLKACKRPINARSETVATSGMVRGALAAPRCLVPMVGERLSSLWRSRCNIY